MTAITEVETQDHFCDGEGCISGIARVIVEKYNVSNADIGGHDGAQAAVTLFGLRIGGLTITAEQLAIAFGAKKVFDFEAQVASDMMEDA